MSQLSQNAPFNRILPNQLPGKAIDEFQTLWEQHYGTELSRKEATLRAHQLLALLQLITKPAANRNLVEKRNLNSDQ
jgi:hypothetical protein